MKIKRILHGFLTISIFFSACSAQKLTVPESLGSQVLEPNTKKILTICLGEEPDSLFLYSTDSHASNLILQAIYDGPFDIEDSKPRPIIFESTPNFEDGSAFLTSIEVIEGDEVINSVGEPVRLQAGVEVFPSVCTSPQCAVIWDGTSPLQMDFISAQYKLKPGLKWSDGQPLKATDSVYSFNLASAPETHANKAINELISSYSAIDDFTVQMSSKPGLVTDSFENFFYFPLPEHAWGKYSAGDLFTIEEVIRSPIGWGAYQVEDWIDGQSLRLSKNPYYFRADENLPYFDELVFKFINPFGDTALSNLKFDRAPFQQFNYDLGEFEKEINENGCDLVTTTSDLRDQLPVLNILLNYFKDPAIKVLKSNISVDQLILFNLNGNEKDASNPSKDLNVRKAVDLCLNRSKMVSDLLFGLYDLVYLDQIMKPDDDPQKNAVDPYDPSAGKALLEQSGWKDSDNNPETPRVSAGVPDMPDGKELGFRLFVEDIDDNLKSSEIVKASLAECGIGINIKPVPPEILWDSENANSIFQGNYDLFQLTWAAPISNPCPLFSSQSIPSNENNFLGLNLSGFRNGDLDKACDQLKMTHMKSDRDALLNQIGYIISENLPMVPLYRYSKLMIAQRYFCAEKIAGNLNNELSIIEEFIISPECR